MTKTESATVHPDRLFVGRTREMNHLLDVLEQVIAGEGRMVTLVGEPGIGKTRTAEEFAKLAQGQGIEVLWGRCYEGEGAPLYWPWMEALRSYLGNHDADEVREHMQSGAAAIAEMVPRLAEHLGGLPEIRRMDDPASARFRLFDAVTTFLKNATAAKTVVIVLDDLHWADGPTLLLLEFLAHRLAETKLLVLGTYRDVDVRRTHPLQQTLGDLNRERLFEKLPLRGLEPEAVRHYVQVASGAAETDELSERVILQSEGNPLFMSETVQLIAEDWVSVSAHGTERSRRSIHIPDGIREVLGRRLSRLSDECNRVLSTASVIGREFGIDILAKLMDEMSEDRLVELLEEAMAAQVAEELPEVYGRYHFNHAVTQQTLTEELSMTRRTRLHARIAEAMEVAYGNEAESHAIEMVEHFANAETVLGSDRLVRYLLLAGEQSLDQYAHEQAAEYFNRGIEAKGDTSADEEMAALYFGLGRAQSAMLDENSIENLRRAFGIYEALGSTEKMVAVATSIHIMHFAGDERIKWLESACDRCLLLVPEDSLAAGRLLAKLPLVRYWYGGNYEQACEQFAKAVSIAQENDDSELEQRALAHWGLAAWNALRHEEGRDLGERALAMARISGDLRGELVALSALGNSASRIGDPRSFDYFENQVKVAERFRDRSYLSYTYYGAGLSALRRADFQRARELFALFADLVGNPEPVAIRLMAIAYESADVEEAREWVDRIMAGIGAQKPTAWTMSSLGLFALKTGDPWLIDKVVPLAKRGFRVISPSAEAKNVIWRAQACLAAAVDDRDAASELYQLKESGVGSSPASSLIALLARSAGMIDKAIELFEEADEPWRRSGQRLFEYWNTFWWAETLLLRGAPGDEERGTELLEELTSDASQCGMVLLETRSRGLIEQTRQPPGGAAKKVHPDGLSQREMEVIELLATGMTNKEIGERLFISVKTVNTHVGNIFEKTGLGNRSEATAYAIRNGITKEVSTDVRPA